MTVIAEFPRAVRVADTLYLGVHGSLDNDADVEPQTRDSFRRMIATIEEAGAEMGDLVNLRTYYVYQGAGGRDVTDYWERMTAERVKHIADPGPAATALRVVGVPGPSNLIGIDGVASLASDRQRIMPDHAWDWSVPVTLSQGWRVDDTIYVGGQISADRAGKAIALGDWASQTRNVLDYIHHVLLDGGMDWADVAHMRICFKHDGDRHAASELLGEIMNVVRATLPQPYPALNAFGVDLLYEGLGLEIDAVARSGGKQPVVPAGSGDWVGMADFPPACVVGDQLYIAGISAPGGASLQAQAEASFDRLLKCVETAGFAPEEIARLTLFFVPEGSPAEAEDQQKLLLDLARQYLPKPGPVVTLLSLTGLPHDGQRFQLDAVAHRGAVSVIL